MYALASGWSGSWWPFPSLRSLSTSTPLHSSTLIHVLPFFSAPAHVLAPGGAPVACAADTLDGYDGTIPGPVYQRGYTSNWCMRVCPLTWWEWLLVSLLLLALVLSIVWCCYCCARRRRKGAEVALASFDGQVPDPNYPHPSYSDTPAYPHPAYSANAYPPAAFPTAPGPSHLGK